MTIEAEINSAPESMWASDERQIINVLQSSDAARIVGEISVGRRDSGRRRLRWKERKKNCRVWLRCRKGKEVFTDPENSFMRHRPRWRLAPVDGQILRRARHVHEIRRAGEVRT